MREPCGPDDRLTVMGWRLIIGVVLALGLTACGSGEVSGPSSSSDGAAATTVVAAPAAEWTAVPPSPLGARASALGVWTGAEVLVFGGEAEAVCPPMADCALPETPALTDGAAFDPATAEWRSLADVPVPVTSFASTAVIGEDVYLLVHADEQRQGMDGGFFRYEVDADRWVTLPTPQGADALVAAGDRLIAYSGSHETGMAGN